jgi:hypothetical protein
MVFEQMLTILLGTGVGVAIVLYSVKPRQVSQSFMGSGSSLGTLSTESIQVDTPMPEVTAIAPTVVEAPVEVHTSPEVSAAFPAGIVAVVPEAAPVSSIEVAAVSAPAVSAVVESSTPATRTRAQRRRTTASKTSARPSRTRKSQV